MMKTIEVFVAGPSCGCICYRSVHPCLISVILIVPACTVRFVHEIVPHIQSNHTFIEVETIMGELDSA